jgi:hypothetical protein
MLLLVKLAKIKIVMSHNESTPQRIIDTSKLIEDLDLREDAEFFAEPTHRIELLQSLTPEDFFDVIQHVNARVRGFEPRNRDTAREEGGTLPLLATPPSKDKPASFRAGFEEIQKYLNESSDDVAQKIKGAAMATEALIIWVHPSEDGNGRTSRFLGKFIEDGTTDIKQLISETVNIDNRLRMYENYLRVDQGNVFKGLDVPFDDAKKENLKKTEMPIAEGIALSIKRLLEDKSVQDMVAAEQIKLQAKLKRAQEIFGQDKIAA